MHITQKSLDVRSEQATECAADFQQYKHLLILVKSWENEMQFGAVGENMKYGTLK